MAEHWAGSTSKMPYLAQKETSFAGQSRAKRAVRVDPQTVERKSRAVIDQDRR